MSVGSPRSTSAALPLLVLLASIGVVALAGVLGGRGVAALALVALGLLAAVSALWSSLHEVASEEESGEADRLAPDLARVASDDALEAALRALIDLDHEVAVGKILPEDEAPLRQELRAEAKRLLRVQHARISPEALARAERVVAEAIASASGAAAGAAGAGHEEATS
jgi:hypothetical protein